MIGARSAMLLLVVQAATTATYQLQVRPDAKRIVVRATVPSDGAVLSMSRSRPGDVPEVADAGWPGLVRSLKVTDRDGRDVGVTSAGAGGWKLDRSIQSPLTLQYEVDLGPLAARDWPAPREAAFADAKHLIAIGRAMFISTPAQRASDVRFDLPKGWRVAAPWPSTKNGTRATVASTDDLTENLVAFTAGSPDVMEAGGFKLKVVGLGHWEPARAEVRRVLGAALERLVAFVGSQDRAGYLVVLLPQLEQGGESFRASHALASDAPPSRANVGAWGNTVAHEVFHHWNGWLLHGEDYASTQWFHEGFTEYAANLALVSGGLISPEEFYRKLAAHVTSYRKLATPLDAPGTHKGPPLYSGGALVAFTWDGMLRESTRGDRGIGDALRALLRATANGSRPYTWADIRGALESVAPGEWEESHRRHIHGTEPLPLASAFARVGLRLVEAPNGARVEPDPSAPAPALAARRSLMGIRR